MNAQFIAWVMAVLFLACAGPMGPPGPAGPSGPAGAPGQAGAPGSGLVATYICNGFAPLASSTQGVGIGHAVYDFADGSTAVTCEVFGPQDTSSSTRWFKGSQVGSQTGACLTTYDVDTPSSGYWSFTINASNSQSTATYHDSGSAHNGRTFTTPCEAF